MEIAKHWNEDERRIICQVAGTESWQSLCTLHKTGPQCAWNAKLTDK